MQNRLPPQPTIERARITEELIRTKETDVARWSSADNLATQWDSRAAMAAKLIGNGQRVLDVGAGAMTLGKLLSKDCTYIPADVVERCTGCLVVDLNKKQFPTGNFDWVTFLGVLEYVHDTYWPLERAREIAPNLVVSYCTDIGADKSKRRGLGWVNDFSKEEFERISNNTGWKILTCNEVKRGPTNIQYMYSCTSMQA
jgi:hypothetical protein